MKSRILFVGKLEDLRTSLDRMRCQWELEFTESSADALLALSIRPYDVVVADRDIHDTDSTELFHKITEEHPKIIRMMLFGQNGQSDFVQSVAPAHQCLPKPCDSEFLEAKVARAIALRRILTNDTLMSCISKMTSLASPPTLYFDIVRELAAGSGKTMTKVGELIAQDIGMTAKILQLVNSAHFGLHVETSNPVHAAKMLGPTTIRALVLTSEVFSQFDQNKVAGVVLAKLLEHSQRVGALARTIAELEGEDKNTIDDAFLAGILHDTGKLVLAGNLPEQYADAVKLAAEQEVPLWQAEQELFGGTHAEVGAYLVGLWGISDPIVESLAFHHQPSYCLDTRFSLVTAVHVANILQHEQQEEAGPSVATSLDEAYIEEIGLSERLPIWRQHGEV
jgi:HD-like signal output (HDOD) protein